MMISATTLICIFFVLCGAGIILALLLPERWNAQALAWIGALASLALLWNATEVLLGGARVHVALWTLPSLTTLTLTEDRLSALFLAVSALVYLAVSIFSAGYLKRYLRRYSLKAFGVMYFGLFAAIVLTLIAGDVLLFFLAWEVMAILSYLLVAYKHDDERHAQAGYLFLAMCEGGTLAAVVALLLLANAADSLQFSALKSAAGDLSDGMRWAVFLLSFFGFGVKAGLVPFNSWLPRVYPVAPANISALLSGVMLNLGLYGIVRVNFDLLPAHLVGTGLVALIIGTISAFIGILYATTENDLNTMLGHSSIENIGIVTAGLGAGFVFTATQHPALAAIAFVTALYHMTNHSLYKALLFIGAGAIVDRAGTCDLDRLGGLIRRMPWTALFFLVGVLSIAAMPPFNGFVSEWLTLQTMLRSAELSSTGVKIVFALCGAALALTAALAITCFVKAMAMGFLGIPRSTRARCAVEASSSMVVPMGLLAVLCVAFGILPTYVISALNHVVQPAVGASAMQALVPPFFAGAAGHAGLPAGFVADFHDIGAQLGQSVMPGAGLVVLHRGGPANPVVFAMSTSWSVVVLIALLVITFVIVQWFTRHRTLARRTRWDGAIRRLLPEMTYTATGFSNPVRVVFNALLRPRTIEDTRETVAEHFRVAIRRTHQQVHPMDRFAFGVLAPALRGTAQLLARMHHGRLNAYVAYVLLTLIVFLIAAQFG